MYTYIYIYVCVYVYVYVYIYIYIYILYYTTIIIISVYVYVCVYTYIYIYIYVCTHTYINNYLRINNQIQIYVSLLWLLACDLPPAPPHQLRMSLIKAKILPELLGLMGNDKFSWLAETVTKEHQHAAFYQTYTCLYLPQAPPHQLRLRRRAAGLGRR